MAKPRQVILLKAVDPRKSDDGLSPLGTLAGLTTSLARYNTAPDRDGPAALAAADGSGIAVLYGPGLIVEISTGQEQVGQIMVTMTDEDFAFPVLLRLCREQQWTMMDPESGRRFGP